ncbi:MAG: thermonuclease family protein [Coriobacteriia bacterium]|nr:thermonuclease family protein [Coriobacteriia bacterium]
MDTAESAAVPLTRATVVRVVDGDTAVFKLKNGRTEKTRFIGIDTPESTNSIEEYGQEATAFTKQSLPKGRTVYLELGVDKRDRYDRLLAYVWLSPPRDDSKSEVRQKMFNAELALAGYAQQMTVPPNSKYASYFREFVAEARDDNRGLWAIDPAAKDR